MGIADVTEQSIMALIFNATVWTNYAQNGATPETNIVVSLNTDDPGEAGTMATSEVAYTGYVRANVLRTSGGWTVSAGSVVPVANIDFPVGTAGGGTDADFFCLGKSGGGAAPILFSGTVSPPIPNGNGITPRLTTGTTISIT